MDSSPRPPFVFLGLGVCLVGFFFLNACFIVTVKHVMKEKFGFLALKMFCKLQSVLFGISAFCYKMFFSGLIFLSVCQFAGG